MKKNITINLFGSLYAIDEDAYELLEKYLDNTKRYFSKRDGGEEIADDIEHRVAELFEEIRISGAEAICIEDIQKIIKRIGNPEDMDDGENISEDFSERESESSNDTNSNDNYRKYFGGRKLYRNPDKQIVGGVLSGLCTYFGGNDPLPWRLIFIILAIFTKIIPFVIIYIILWAIIPMAITSEDKLKMKGKPVNINTLNEEIMTDPIDIEQGKIMSVFNTMITIIGFCLKLFFGFLICVCLFALLVVVFGLLQGFITPFSLTGFDDVFEDFMNNFLVSNPSVTIYIWISVISSILFFSILLYSIIHSIVKKNSGQRMSTLARLTMIIMTIVSLSSSIVFGISAYNKIDNAVANYEHERNTMNGVYLAGDQHQRIAENGWEIMCYENASDRVMRTTNDFFEDIYDISYLSFRRQNSRQPMNINMRRTEEFPAGTYHLEAIVSAKSNGAYVYAKNDSTTMAYVMIPVDDSRNRGNMQSMSEEQLREISFFDFDKCKETTIESDFYNKISYWSFVRSESFRHKGGPINYGITNIGTVIGKDEIEVPAWRFSLRNIKVVKDEK